MTETARKENKPDHTWSIVHYEVNTAGLVHELDQPGEDQPATCLDSVITDEEMGETLAFVLKSLPLNSHLNSLALRSYFPIRRFFVINDTENLPCLFFLTSRIQPSRRLRQSQNKHHHNDGKKHLHGDW